MPRSPEQPHDACGRPSRSARRVYMVAAALVLVGAVVASSAVALTAHANSNRRPPAPVLALPSAKQCVSKRDLTILVRKISGVTVLGVTVKVNGKLFKRFKRSQVTKFLKLSTLPKGTFVVSVTAEATDGRSVTVTRTYRSCVTTLPAPRAR